MQCQRCGSFRVLNIQAHGRDCNNFELLGHEFQGYVPDDLGIGSGDDVECDVCLECGQMQGKFPIPPTRLEAGVQYVVAGG